MGPAPERGTASLANRARYKPALWLGALARNQKPNVSVVYRTTLTGGERGIRTLDRVLPYTPLAGARLRPLGHLSIVRETQLETTFTAARCRCDFSAIPICGCKNITLALRILGLTAATLPLNLAGRGRMPCAAPSRQVPCTSRRSRSRS